MGVLETNAERCGATYVRVLSVCTRRLGAVSVWTLGRSIVTVGAGTGGPSASWLVTGDGLDGSSAARHR